MKQLSRVALAALLLVLPGTALGEGDGFGEERGLEAEVMPGVASPELVSASLDSEQYEAAMPARGLQEVSRERLSAAVGHYARARSLLIAAIREFDKGYKIARPDALLDSAEWRNTLLDRAEALERVLDPQPRVTRGGVRYEPDRRLLGEAQSVR